MSDLLPCFTSHYSMQGGDGSRLTFEAKGKSKAGGPPSIVDLCLSAGLKDCMAIESNLGGMVEAYKNLTAANINLFFGYKVVVCDDERVKDEKSLSSESKVIIFPRNDAGKKRLISIANTAATDGFYYRPRTSWRQLKEVWTDDLELALPFFSSFIARNTLTLNHVIADLPARPTIFREVEPGLPFAPLIDEALNRFNAKKEYDEQRVKTIYYDTRRGAKSYFVYRARQNRGTFSKPNIDHLASDRFCFDEYRRLAT